MILGSSARAVHENLWWRSCGVPQWNWKLVPQHSVNVFFFLGHSMLLVKRIHNPAGPNFCPPIPG